MDNASPTIDRSIELVSSKEARFRLAGHECIVVPQALNDRKDVRQLGTFVLKGCAYAVVATPSSKRTTALASMTPRELEIALLVAIGLDAKSIARRLRISFHTVRVHIGHIYTKLGLHKQTELAAWIAKQFIDQ
jgi:DNA-binding CsgD family transcriptional regulator